MIEKNLQRFASQHFINVVADGTMKEICKNLNIKRLENILNISNPNLLRGKYLNKKQNVFLGHAAQNGRISKEHVTG